MCVIILALKYYYFTLHVYILITTPLKLGQMLYNPSLLPNITNPKCVLHKGLVNILGTSAPVETWSSNYTSFHSFSGSARETHD